MIQLRITNVSRIQFEKTFFLYFDRDKNGRITYSRRDGRAHIDFTYPKGMIKSVGKEDII